MKKYFSFKEGFTDKLPNLNETNYLKIEICPHTEKEVIVLYYFDMKFDDSLCLHSEDEENTKKSVELFKQENIEFSNCLEFFRDDNPHLLNKILESELK